MANLPSWITDRAIPIFPGEPFRPEPNTRMFDEDGFAKLANSFGLSKDRLHDKCDISWTMKNGHKAWIFTDDALSALNKRRISVMESKGPNMKRRIREGIVSTKDGDKTFDQLYGAGIDTDESDSENAQMFAHCFEAIAAKTRAPRLREHEELVLPASIRSAIDQFRQERDEDDWEAEQLLSTPRPRSLEYQRESSSIPARMVKDYESRAKAELDAGATIEIRRNPCYVALTMSDGSEYFFQDDEADDLLNEVPDNINEEDYILAVAQGW